MISKMTIESDIRNHKSFTSSRLRSLYSDFSRLKELNPEGYEANLQAWNSLIVDLVKKGHFGLFSFLTREPKLTETLALSDYGRPLSMGEVLQFMLDSEAIIPLSQYITRTSKFIPKNEDNGITGAPRRFISWISALVGINTIKSSDSKGTLVKESYILWDRLVLVANDILRYLQDMMKKGTYSDHLYTSSLLQTHVLEYMKRDVDKGEIDILLKYWSRDVQVCVVGDDPEDNQTVVKFGNDLISPEDISVAKLRENVEKAAKRELGLQQKLDETSESISGLLRKKMKTDDTTRQQIKSRLFRKKLLAKAYTRTSDVYMQLSTILTKIDDSSDNAATFHLLTQSAEVLLSFNSKLNVDDVLDLKEEITQQSQITDEMTGVLNETEETCDEEIEQELQQMLRESQKVEAKDTTGVPETEKEVLDKLENLNITNNELNKEEKDEQRRIPAQ